MSNKTKDKLNIIVTGGTGRFGSMLKKIKTNYNVFYPNKKELNILNSKSIEDYIKKKEGKNIDTLGWPFKTNEHS